MGFLTGYTWRHRITGTQTIHWGVPVNYWNITTFLNDDEAHKVFDIIENALDRHGWVGTDDDAELSIRLYDPNLKQDIDAYTEYDPEPCEVDHPLFHTH